MTPRNDTLEADLRAVLEQRARDVGPVPESVFAFEHAAATVTSLSGRDRVGPSRRPLLLAVAAAVITVLATIGTVVSVTRARHDRLTPPAQTGTNLPTAGPTPGPTPGPSEHVTRSARLSWFGFTTPRGYGLGERDSLVGHQTLGLSTVGDRDPIPGDNGGSPWQTYVTVYEPGALTTRTPHRTADTTRVGTATAYYGSYPLTGDHREPDVATLAWLSPRGRWVIVQGRTIRASTPAALLEVARAVHPDTTTPVDVPFRLTYAPPGTRVTEMYADPGGRHSPFRIELASPAGDIELVVATDLTRTGIDPTMPVSTRLIDGLTTRTQLSTSELTSATTLGPQEFVGIGVGPADAGTGHITATQRTLFERLLDNVRFVKTSATEQVRAGAAIP